MGEASADPRAQNDRFGKRRQAGTCLDPARRIYNGIHAREREAAGKLKRPAEDRPLANEESRRITISKPFYMAITETTQEQFEGVTCYNPSGFSHIGANKKKVAGVDTSKFPIERVTWYQAADVCDMIGGRLPTEAQWEYACRAGTTSAYSFGDAHNGKDANCNGALPFGTKVKGPIGGKTEVVTRHAANPFGIYGMHGNVREWCADFYDDQLDDLPTKDPERTAKKSMDARVVRGGSWYAPAVGGRSAFRMARPIGSMYDDLGFRVVVPVLP